MLVTLEGIDGSGKTTIISALQEVYPDAIYTLEPTDSWYGDAVQKSIKTATFFLIAILLSVPPPFKRLNSYQLK